MGTPFTKMHGAGNDYIYLDAFSQETPDDLPSWAKRVCHRHFGIGADGVIVIRPTETAAARIEMWNADGSRGSMCGNGLRCVAKYVFDRNLVTETSFIIETDAGPKRVWIKETSPQEAQVRVEMGAPIFEPTEIPTRLPGTPPLDVPLEVNGRSIRVSAISMGNPHCVVWVEEPNDDWVLKVGPQIETHPVFPDRTNVEFVQVLSRDELQIRVWERGSGETQACGTGACAVVVAGVLLGHCNRHVTCHLPGGELDVHWNEADEQVVMTGPAVEIYRGVWPD